MFSISRVSSIADLPSPVAICCHDAGGANLVAAWVAAAASQDFRICVDGPARTIFSNAVPRRVTEPLSAVLDGAQCLLSSSGWSSALEHQARVEAKRRGMPVLAVLDHWVNYRMRFIRDEVESLPDVLIVTDREAAAMAAATFGAACRIVMWDNRYLQSEVAKVLSYPQPVIGARAARLLIVLEPVRQDWSEGATEEAEFRALDFLLNNLAAIFADPDEVEVRLRPHPSESPAKYLPWLRRQERPRLELSEAQSLAEDIAWSDVAAGLQSYALVVALESGRRAVSYLLPGAPPCSVRHAGLERLTDLIGMAS